MMVKKQKADKGRLLRIVNYWIPPLLWSAVIFTFSTLPTVQTTDIFLGDFLFKKSAHVIEYGILATLLYRALINSNINTKKAMWYAVILSSLYGISDEFHQSFVPGRTPTLRDMLIDTAGASIFIFGIVGNIERMPTLLKKLYTRFDIR